MKTDLKKALNEAFDRLPHPSFEDIAAAPVKKMETMDYITRQEPAGRRKYRRAAFRLALPVCLCLMITAGIGNQYVRQNLLVDSVIDLDVNPSFEITSNKKDRVLRVEGLNPEAGELLEGRSYRGWELGETVEALLISLDDRQYINAGQNTILLSVSNKDADKAEQMKSELSKRIVHALADTGVKPVIVRQNRSDDEELAQKAVRYQISPGKMQLVEKLAREAPELREEELTNIPVEELYRLLRQQEADIPEWLDVDEDDWYEEGREADDRGGDSDARDDSDDDDKTDDRDDSDDGGKSDERDDSDDDDKSDERDDSDDDGKSDERDDSDDDDKSDDRDDPDDDDDKSDDRDDSDDDSDSDDERGNKNGSSSGVNPVKRQSGSSQQNSIERVREDNDQDDESDDDDDRDAGPGGGDDDDRHVGPGGGDDDDHDQEAHDSGDSDDNDSDNDSDDDSDDDGDGDSDDD